MSEQSVFLNEPVRAECSSLFLRIPPGRIAFLKFLLEGYDNLCVLSTIDPVAGIVVLRFPEDSSREVWEVLDGLAPLLERRTEDLREETPNNHA